MKKYDCVEGLLCASISSTKKCASAPSNLSGLNIKHIKDGIIQRRIKNDIKIAVLLNEKEGGIMFSTIKGKPDISKMFYGDSKLFHEWCLDYFRYSWHNANLFREEKLKKM